MPKTKILYLVSTLKKSGPIIVVANIIKYLDRNNFEPVVLTMSNEPINSMKNYFLKDLNVSVETIGLSRFKGIFFAKKAIVNFIKTNKIDLIHSHGIRSDFVISGCKYAKTIATLHNYPYYDYQISYGKLLGIIMTKIHLYSLKNIDKKFVVSESISNIFKKKHRYTIGYICNGVDIKKFKIADKKKLREKFGFLEDDKVFISVGHLSMLKDPLTIIRAFRTIQDKKSKLIFLGQGDLEETCKKEGYGCENIRFVGFVENVQEYLSASDYFISASLAEGLPNSVLEAMSCGLPCLLSEISPHIEIHEKNIKSSCIFKNKDSDELREKIDNILKQDYNLLSHSAKNIVLENFTAEMMSKKYQKEYYELIG